MGERCRWHHDKDVPGGRFLVPGCWSRVIGGDGAECQCDTGDERERLEDRMNRLETKIDALIERLGDRALEGKTRLGVVRDV